MNNSGWANRLVCLALVWVAVSVLVVAGAQPVSERWQLFADPVFFNLSGENGLPFGRVAGIAHGPDGYAWLVTADGLARWDGLVLSPVRSGIPDVDTDIRVIETCPDGFLWVGTGKGLYRFNTRSREWKPVALLRGEQFGVLSLGFSGGSGSVLIWAGTERGIFSVGPGISDVSHYLARESAQDLTLRVFSIVSQAGGDIWAATSIGLFRRRANDPEFTRANDPEFARVNLMPALASDSRIAALEAASNGDIWLGTPRDGVFRVGEDGAVRPVSVPDFAGEWIFSMAEVSPGVMWLGSYGRGLIEVPLDGGAARRMKHHPTLGHSLIDNEIWTIRPDQRGLVWVGTSAGVSVRDLSQKALLTAFGGGHRSNSLRDPAVTSLLELESGGLLIGLRESGVDLVDSFTGRVGEIQIDPDNPDLALPGGAIEAMVQSEAGDILIGSNWGIYQFSNGAVQRLQFSARPAAVFTGSLLARHGQIWAGGSDGLWRLSLGGPSSEAEQVEASITEAFTDPRITTMMSLNNNRLMVGTWNGVTTINRAGEVVSRLPRADQLPSPLANGYVTSLLQDPKGRTWIATSGAGIYVRSGSGQLRQITREQGLPSNQMGNMQLDQLGRVWASSNGGLAVIFPQDFSVYPLGPSDGALATPYFRQPGLVTQSGEILFGGARGLTIIRPELWRPSEGFATLLIDSVRVGGTRLDPYKAGSKPDQPVLVPARSNELSVSFVALDYLAARDIRYRHQLVGVDSQWRPSEAGSRNVTYTSLPPGDYTLKVQASNRQGRWGGPVRTRYIRVLPLWYQSSLALWLGVLTAALLMLVTLRLRTAQLKNRQLELERLIGQRTAELEATAAQLKEKSKALETASLTDPLTGMHNRRFVEQQLPPDQAMCLRRYRGRAGQPIEAADLLFFMVDIDRFKQVNDRYGHSAGDAVLTAMPGRLAAVFRESDHQVRWGGEEFLVVARDASRQYVQGVAQRILSQVSAEPFDLGDGQTLDLTCSVGYCPLPFDLSRPDALKWQDAIRLADQALYAAKRGGRNAWVGVSQGPALVGAEDPSAWLDDTLQALVDNMIKLDSNLDPPLLAQVWETAQNLR